jgi:hypothetical protein
MSALAFARTTNNDTAVELQEMQNKLVAYLNAVVKITADAHTVRNAVLLAVHPGHEPDWYAQLNANFTRAQTHAANWLDTILPDFTNVPQAIINYNNTFTTAYDMIMKILNEVGTGGPTTSQQAELLLLFAALVDALREDQAMIQTVRDQIVQFNDDLAADNTALTTGAASIIHAIADDYQRVIDLNANIASLQAQIASMNQLITFGGIGTAGFFVVSMLLMNTGPLAIAVGVIGVGGSIAAIIAATVIIGRDQAKILDDQAEISAENQQIIVLTTIANTVSILVKTIQDAVLQMDPVLTTWATLGVKMQAVTDLLKKASGPDWLKILNEELDMGASKRAWDQLTDFATKMQQTSITVSNDAPVTIPRAA